MKTISRLLIAVALLGTGSLTLATPSPRDQDRHNQGHGEQQHRRANQDTRHHDRRRDEHRRHRDYRRHGDDHRRYGYRHERRHYRHWERGHHYRGPAYTVRDYRHYRLRPPPRGYRWVRADNDYLLVAITTGIILDIATR
jgi:Ni/Co efflux regulator RcnB